jgi:DUF438 domain-containing protein
MSEYINNREFRQQKLKELILQLHEGKSVEEVKEEFERVFGGVQAKEISDLEQSLIAEGMSVEEVQRLCDVHAAVFKGSIEEIHRQDQGPETPGHPVHTFKAENRAIEDLMDNKLKPAIASLQQSDEQNNIFRAIEIVNELADIDKHYSRKENLLFPYLEKYGITAPPKVMWGVDDQIRSEIKKLKKMLTDYQGDKEAVVKQTEEVVALVKDMIFKEEKIFLEMVLDNLSEDEWVTIRDESPEIGYCLVEPGTEWDPPRKDLSSEVQKDQAIRFPTGVLKPQEINLILNHLPVDITYIDKDDIVKYFSGSPERVFARPKTIIGRNVQNCHPPASVHVVEKLVDDFKQGRKNSESFWINMKDKYVYIRYFAVRDENGTYMGTMEVTQDIRPLQAIEGEKRLLS